MKQIAGRREGVAPVGQGGLAVSSARVRQVLRDLVAVGAVKVRTSATAQ
jgi:hypothetical protein